MVSLNSILVADFGFVSVDDLGILIFFIAGKFANQKFIGILKAVENFIADVAQEDIVIVVAI